jgi:hypothetical protein
MRPFGCLDFAGFDAFQREHDVNAPQHEDSVLRLDVAVCDGSQ